MLLYDHLLSTDYNSALIARIFSILTAALDQTCHKNYLLFLGLQKMSSQIFQNDPVVQIFSCL